MKDTLKVCTLKSLSRWATGHEKHRLNPHKTRRLQIPKPYTIHFCVGIRVKGRLCIPKLKNFLKSFKQPLTPSPIFLDVFADFWMEASLCLKYYLYALFNIMKHFLESISNLLAVIFISWLLQCKNIFNICIKAKYGERSYFPQFFFTLSKRWGYFCFGCTYLSHRLCWPSPAHFPVC